MRLPKRNSLGSMSPPTRADFIFFLAMPRFLGWVFSASPFSHPGRQATCPLKKPIPAFIVVPHTVRPFSSFFNPYSTSSFFQVVGFYAGRRKAKPPVAFPSLYRRSAPPERPFFSFRWIPPFNSHPPKKKTAHNTLPLLCYVPCS